MDSSSPAPSDDEENHNSTPRYIKKQKNAAAPDFDSKLVDYIQDYPALYVVNSKHWKKTEIKNNAYLELTKKLGLPPNRAERVKARWTYLKDKYVRQKWLLKEPSGTGTDEILHHPWPLFPILHELLRKSYGKKRKTAGSWTLPPGREERPASDDETPMDAAVISENQTRGDKRGFTGRKKANDVDLNRNFPAKYPEHENDVQDDGDVDVTGETVDHIQDNVSPESPQSSTQKRNTAIDIKKEILSPSRSSSKSQRPHRVTSEDFLPSAVPNRAVAPGRKKPNKTETTQQTLQSINHLIEDLEKSPENQLDNIDHFAMMVGEEVRRLPPEIQDSVKIQIMSLITRAKQSTTAQVAPSFAPNYQPLPVYSQPCCSQQQMPPNEYSHQPLEPIDHSTIVL